MKKYAFILLLFAAVAQSVPAAAKIPETDGYAASESKVMAEAQSEWAEPYIQKAINNGFLTKDMRGGYTEYITRCHFCEIVYNMLTKWGVDTISASGIFNDTDSPAVNALYAIGIVNGKDEKHFAPEDSLTREEAAAILTRIALLMEIRIEAPDIKFDDDASISDWARDSVYKMYSCGVMNGVSERLFSPKDKYTKEQAVATVVRLYELAG